MPHACPAENPRPCPVRSAIRYGRGGLALQGPSCERFKPESRVVVIGCCLLIPLAQRQVSNPMSSHSAASSLQSTFYWMKYPAKNRKKKARSDPKINRLFCPPVRELVPSPYLWFSAKPAISFAFDWNLSLSAPQMGQFQSSGRPCNRQ